MKKSCSLLAVCFLASMMSHQVQAAASASASFGTFSIQLFDLNPLDSIAPTINWNIAPSGTSTPSIPQARAAGYLYSYNNSTGSNGFPSFSQLNNPLTSGYNFSGLGSTNSSHVATVANNPSGLSAIAEGNVQSAGTFGSVYQLTSTGYSGGIEFSLTPYTLAVFSTFAQVSAETTTGIPNGAEGASASATLNVTSYGNPLASQTSTGSIAVKAGNERGINLVPDSAFDSGLLSASFTNSSNTEGFARLSLKLGVAGSTLENYNPIPSVPEPETYAMLLTGLGLVNFVSKRRKTS